MRSLALASGLVIALALWPAHDARAVEVEARVGRRALTMGETTPLEVVVRGAVSGVHDPEFDVPPGLEVLGSGRSTSFSSINGRMTTETLFRYELAPSRAGSYALGPIRVRVGDQVFESAAMTLSVSAAGTRIGPGGEGPASLVVDVAPREPYVGQPVLMRVRLIQRASLAEDPRYTPPPTTGFWTERASEPESYYADEARTRVLVTETRSRLYPLASGETTIGEATAVLALEGPRPLPDPLQWFRGGLPRREVVVRSAPARVRVRALPSGAPPGFDGAVGNLSVAWSADRARTSQDVPVTVRLEVRGPGNLPLLHTPPLPSRDFEVFAGTVDDSLGVPGSMNGGRRGFQWTILPRRQGRLTLEAPELVWFDPGAGAYRRAASAPIEIEVGAPLAPGAPAADAFPAAFSEHPVDPFRRGGEPWAFALAGLALGAAFRMWRSARRPDPDGAERARQREWLHAVGRSRGSDFWAAADQACAWLERRGRPAPPLRAQVAASRYGGARAEDEAVRAELVQRVSTALRPRAATGMGRIAAVPVAATAVALCLLFGPRAGDHRNMMRARGADQAARSGDITRARREWSALWREGSRAPGLAARLAWAAVTSGEIGPATRWALRGDAGEPREPALVWVAGQVREAGGLAGFSSQRLPVRRIEWSALALMAGFVALWAWPRRAIVLGALALLVLSAGADPARGWLASRVARGVVSMVVRLDATDLELEPGQVVTVLERKGDRVKVRAGREVTGWLPSSALEILERVR